MKISHRVYMSKALIMFFILLSSSFMLYGCGNFISDIENALADIINQANTVPTPPLSVKAKAGNARVRVSWSAPVYTGIINRSGTKGAITKYVVYYSTNSRFDISDRGVFQRIQSNPSAHWFVVTGLVNGTPYYFVVTAFNEMGESTKSNKALATPSAQN